jgi:hypothetical protein
LPAAEEDYDVIIRVNTEAKSFAFASLQARHEKAYPKATTDVAELCDAVARANFGLSVGEGRSVAAAAAAAVAAAGASA